MNKLKDINILVSRILLAVLFVIAGYGKIQDYDATAGYMQSMHVPAFLLPLVILLELGGGIAIIFGFLTRFTAISIGIFSIVAALLFHNDFSQEMNQMMLMKDFAIAGGFFLLASIGAGKYSIESIIKKKTKK